MADEDMQRKFEEQLAAIRASTEKSRRAIQDQVQIIAKNGLLIVELRLMNVFASLLLQKYR